MLEYPLSLFEFNLGYLRMLVEDIPVDRCHQAAFPGARPRNGCSATWRSPTTTACNYWVTTRPVPTPGTRRLARDRTPPVSGQLPARTNCWKRSNGERRPFERRRGPPRPNSCRRNTACPSNSCCAGRQPSANSSHTCSRRTSPRTWDNCPYGGGKWACRKCFDEKLISVFRPRPTTLLRSAQVSDPPHALHLRGARPRL